MCYGIKAVCFDSAHWKIDPRLKVVIFLLYVVCFCCNGGSGLWTVEVARTSDTLLQQQHTSLSEARGFCLNLSIFGSIGLFTWVTPCCMSYTPGGQEPGVTVPFCIFDSWDFLHNQSGTVKFSFRVVFGKNQLCTVHEWEIHIFCKVNFR